MTLKLDGGHLPTGPGIYRFFIKNKKGEEGEVLYIGKAVNLRKRLQDHRRSKNPKIQALLNQATAVDWELTASEAEALLREAELIKRHQPRYNTLLRDDSQYFYVGFANSRPATADSRPPWLFVTHHLKRNLPIDYLGPFTEGRALRQILKIIRPFLPFCTCRQPHRRECLNAHLGLCPGWCCAIGQQPSSNRQQQKYYRQNIAAVKEILKGNFNQLKKIMLIKLAQELKRNNLERATQLKHGIEAIKVLSRQRLIGTTTAKQATPTERLKILRELQQLLKLKTLPERIEAYDCSHFGGSDRVGTMIAFEQGQYAPSQTRYFKIRGKAKDDLAMLEEVLNRRLRHSDWTKPNLILVDGGLTQFRSAQAVLQNWAGTGLERSRQISLISFAKPLRQLYFHSTKPPVALATLPAALRFFLEEVDARVHRAAIGFHRRLRGRHF